MHNSEKPEIQNAMAVLLASLADRTEQIARRAKEASKAAQQGDFHAALKEIDGFQNMFPDAKALFHATMSLYFSGWNG